MERYESLGLVGEGSYGTVLKCRHRDTGRLVAIKKFTDSDSDKTVKKIATREIKLLRKLSHDNLVNLLEVWKRRRRWYLVFEFVDRTLLEDLEQHPSGLDLNTTRQYLYQILRAAAFCHEQNIIHRDIKPENVLVSQGGVVKLCDFGLARTMASPAEGGVYTDYVATRWYRAPELLVGDLKYGKPVDVWAVGCLFLEMLTGQPLFPGDSDLDQIYHIIKCFGNLTAHHQELFTRSPAFSGVRLPECFVPVPLQDHCPTITPTALDLAQSCLQMDPEGRAQCSQLLEHPLFTLDCFHIRFLDELNAKIQKDHRENSTLPKIIKTPRHDKDDGNDKKQKGKNRKHLGSMDEKVIKGKEKKDWKEDEKLEKTRAKQPSNLPKTNQNKSDSLVSKQSKTLGANLIDNTTGALIDKKGDPGKATTSELRQEPDVCTKAKTFSSDLSEGTENRTGLKDNNKVAAKDEKQDYLKITENPEDADCSSLQCGQSGTAVPNETEKNMMDISRFSKSETSQEFWKNRSNTHRCAFSQSTTTDHPGSSLTLQVHPLSVNNYADVTTKSVTKPCKMDTGVEHQSIVAVPETQKVSDNADKEDLAQLAATSIVNQTSKIHGCSSSEQKNNETEPKSLLKEPQETFGSFVNHTKLTTTLTPKTVFHKEERKTSDNAGGKDAVYTSIAVRPTATTDHQTLTRGFVLHNVDTTTYNEFVHDSCPPPPPSSTPLLLPLPSTPLMPSFSVIGTNSPPTSDHLTLGPGFHPVSLSLRYGDKPRHHGGIYSRPGRLSLTTPITASQVSDKNLIREQSDHCNHVHSGCPAMAKKLDIHFPDVQSLGLPELRGRDGKNNKVIAKDQKKSKNPALHDSASELHQYRHNSTDTYHTQKH